MRQHLSPETRARYEINVGYNFPHDFDPMNNGDLRERYQREWGRDIPWWSMQIPDATEGALLRYLLLGVPPGPFLSAVLCNDLFGAVGHADDQNTAYGMKAVMVFLYNYAPSDCYKSVEKAVAWCEAGGLLEYQGAPQEGAPA